MAHGAKIEVQTHLNVGPGSFIRRRDHTDQVFIVMESNRRWSRSEKGIIFDNCKDSYVCMPIDGIGTPVNFTDTQIEPFKGKITITV